MAASVTVTESSAGPGNPVIVRRVDWQADGSGNINLPLALPNGTVINFGGGLLQIAYTKLYGLTLLTGLGFDLLAGLTANASTSVGVQDTPKNVNGFPLVLYGPLTLVGASLGANVSGTFILITR